MKGFLVLTANPLAVAARFADAPFELTYSSLGIFAIFFPSLGFSLPEMQRGVNGFIELFDCRYSEPMPVAFLCNEEGAIMDPPLPYLPLTICGHHIRGDVFVCGSRDGEFLCLTRDELVSHLPVAPMLNADSLVEIKKWVDRDYRLGKEMLGILMDYCIGTTSKLNDVYRRL